MSGQGKTEEQLKQVLSYISELSSSSTTATTTSSKDLLPLSTILLAQLKQINRTIHLDTLTQKNRVAEERSKVDTARIALQNLKYEQTMLQDEVKRCQEFMSIYQDVDLHPLEEFYQRVDKDSVSNDSHQLMLNRLGFELQERQRLETEKQQLQTEKSVVIKENKDKKSNLEAAEKELKDLLTMANTVQSKFQSL